MSTARIQLRGTTWQHSRGFLPMVATAQRFTELHPEVEITWERRSLKAFEDYPVERLAAEFDLIVLDHPAVSQGARRGALLALDEHLPPDFLADQARNSVGASHGSYGFNGHHWSLAIDAAAPIAFWRDDLLRLHGLTRPETWDEVLSLARLGRVEIPAAPINCLMNFYTFCIVAGETPFTRPDRVIVREVGRAALARLRELLGLCDAGCWKRNPIASHELVAGAANADLVYCPLAYGYSNYARVGYAAQRLTAGEPPTVNGARLHTTLGGAGLALSALRPQAKAALAYAAFVASAQTQRTLYTHSGGQPGHRSAWIDAENNRITGDYFSSTLPVLERAYLRPRYPGYLTFQDEVGPIIHRALQRQIDDDMALDQLDALYRESLTASNNAAA